MKKRTSKEIFGEALLRLAKTETVERITVKQIVAESGLSLQTFYNHFHDKEDLLLWLYRRGGDRSIARLGNRRVSFHELALESIRFFKENGNFLRGVLVSPYAETAVESAYAFFASYICVRMNAEELPEDLAFFLRMFIYACLHVFREYSAEGWKLPEEKLAEYLEQGMPEKLKPWLLR